MTTSVNPLKYQKKTREKNNLNISTPQLQCPSHPVTVLSVSIKTTQHVPHKLWIRGKRIEDISRGQIRVFAKDFGLKKKDGTVKEYILE